MPNHLGASFQCGLDGFTTLQRILVLKHLLLKLLLVRNLLSFHILLTLSILWLWMISWWIKTQWSLYWGGNSRRPKKVWSNLLMFIEKGKFSNWWQGYGQVMSSQESHNCYCTPIPILPNISMVPFKYWIKLAKWLTSSNYQSNFAFIVFFIAPITSLFKNSWGYYSCHYVT